MTQTTIEFVQGSESHSSYWGKFYVKGLEKYEVKEDFPENCHDRHHNYQGYVCLNVPTGTIFTIFEQSGNKYGTTKFSFYICAVCEGEKPKTFEPEYGSGFLKGGFLSIAGATTKIKAKRLMDWWIGSNNHSLAFAEHCALHINKRGLKELPPLSSKKA